MNGRVVWSEYDWPIDLFVEDLRTVIDLGDDMRIKAFTLILLLIIPGCLSGDEEITFHGRDLGGNDTYKFTLEDAKGPLWNLEDQERKSCGSSVYFLPGVTILVQLQVKTSRW